MSHRYSIPSEATVFAALKIIMEFIAVIAKERQTK